MRRIVHDYVAAAIDRARPHLEHFIADHLGCSDAVPLVFTDPMASIREIRSLKIKPRFPVDVGTRMIAIEVEVAAVGTVAGHGYDVVPEGARLTAWWGG